MNREKRKELAEAKKLIDNVRGIVSSIMETESNEDASSYLESVLDALDNVDENIDEAIKL